MVMRMAPCDDCCDGGCRSFNVRICNDDNDDDNDNVDDVSVDGDDAVSSGDTDYFQGVDYYLEVRHTILNTQSFRKANIWESDLVLLNCTI